MFHASSTRCLSSYVYVFCTSVLRRYYYIVCVPCHICGSCYDCWLRWECYECPGLWDGLGCRMFHVGGVAGVWIRCQCGIYGLSWTRFSPVMNFDTTCFISSSLYLALYVSLVMVFAVIWELTFCNDFPCDISFYFFHQLSKEVQLHSKLCNGWHFVIYLTRTTTYFIIYIYQIVFIM